MSEYADGLTTQQRAAAFNAERATPVAERATVSRVDHCPSCGATLTVRSAEQNSLLHAVLTDIAEQKQWAGQWLDSEDWKRLLVAAFGRANGNPPTVLPSVDGHGVDMIFRRTHRMSKQEMSELIEFATSWAIDNGVQLRERVPLWDQVT